VLLLQELRSKLDAYGAETGKYYEITAAVGCGPSVIAGYDIPNTAPLLDQINMMTYDFFGAWSDVTGANAPLYYQGFPEGYEEWSVDGCVNNWKKGGAVDAQLNIGLPFYGQSYVDATGFNQQHRGNDKAHWGVDDGKPQYFNIEAKLGEMEVQRDDVSHTQMAWFPDGSGFISFDDEQAICDKVQYVQEHNLNGFIIWELSGDVRQDLSTPLLDEVNRKLNNPSYDCSNAASSAYTAADESGKVDSGLSDVAVAMIIVAVLSCIAVVAGIAIWRCRRREKDAVPDMEEVEEVEEVREDVEVTMEIEVEVNETNQMKVEPVTTTQD